MPDETLRVDIAHLHETLRPLGPTNGEPTAVVPALPTPALLAPDLIHDAFDEYEARVHEFQATMTRLLHDRSGEAEMKRVKAVQRLLDQRAAVIRAIALDLLAEPR